MIGIQHGNYLQFELLNSKIACYAGLWGPNNLILSTISVIKSINEGVKVSYDFFVISNINESNLIYFYTNGKIATANIHYAIHL